MNNNYPETLSCAQTIVRILEQHGVTHVFGVPGAKIDSLFIALKQSSIRLVVVRHEQSAAFMAAAFGRKTGKVGVCIATSGPGVANLVTGLATATTEGDPVLAIGGEVAIDDRLKHTHQSLDAVTLMRSVAKYSAEVVSPGQLGEVMGNAIRCAESGRPGASFVSLPKDVGLAPFVGCTDHHWGAPLRQGPAASMDIELAASLLNKSRKVLVLLGLQASRPDCASSIQALLKRTGWAYAATFQGPGKWAEPQGQTTYVGRLGLFRNQPADQVLDQADCVFTIGFDAVEYDPSVWNARSERRLVALDVLPVAQDNDFLPDVELVGDIAASLNLLTSRLTPVVDAGIRQAASRAREELEQIVDQGRALEGSPVAPLRLVHELRKIITDKTLVALDVGSHYIWMNRYLAADFARQVFVSNGQQTLGVALPWAIALSLMHPDKQVVSVSGDGGFLFTGSELETARRVGAKFVHVIWDSASYDMVAFQEAAHYGGQTAGVDLSTYDIVSYAAAFGCVGYRVNDTATLAQVLRDAVSQSVPAIVSVAVDYSQNADLMKDLHHASRN